WRSTTATVATVTTAGLVHAVGVGSTNVIASVDGREATVVVRVVAVTAVSVQIAPSTLSLNVGQSQTLSATARDASGNVIPGKVFAWRSSNSSIATVSADGAV